jgi:hypothetical protein
MFPDAETDVVTARASPLVDVTREALRSALSQQVMADLSRALISGGCHSCSPLTKFNAQANHLRDTILLLLLITIKKKEHFIPDDLFRFLLSIFEAKLDCHPNTRTVSLCVSGKLISDVSAFTVSTGVRSGARG